ncbi:hypothetical protein GB937_000033, partial [Aspergillus fischeri]
ATPWVSRIKELLLVIDIHADWVRSGPTYIQPSVQIGRVDMDVRIGSASVLVLHEASMRGNTRLE